MPQNNMAVGNKVYNGGSNAAQRGQQLDPSGYIQRNLQQRNQPGAQQQRQGVGQGGMPIPPSLQGPSQQRSGLAAQAMQGMEQGAVGTTSNPNIGGLAPLNLASQVAGQVRQQGSPLTSQIKTFDPSGPSFSPAAPTVKMPGVPSSITGSLKSPLDVDLRNQRDQGFNTLNQQITQLQSILDQLNAEYQQNVRDFGVESDRQYLDLASMFAAMGGGPGTGYGQAYGDLTRDLTNYRSDLDTAFSRSQQDILADRTANINRFQTLIRGLAGTQADRDARKRAEAALKRSTRV